jgi:putative hydrolase of the HAD superfamily
MATTAATKTQRFKVTLWDWADTVMVDTDPTSPLPMCEWADLRLVPGVEAVLRHCEASGRQVVLATSAAVSDEAQIRRALDRVGVDKYFRRVFCQRNTGLGKCEAFYRKIVAELGAAAEDVLMIGDSLEKDIVPAEKAGISALWYNESGKKQGTAKATVTSMAEMLQWFQHLDA